MAGSSGVHVGRYRHEREATGHGIHSHIGLALHRRQALDKLRAGEPHDTKVEGLTCKKNIPLFLSPMGLRGPAPGDDSNRIPSKKVEYAREYARQWRARQGKRCPCSRPAVDSLDSVPICAYCLEIETRRLRRHLRPNPNSIESAEAYNLHLPNLSLSFD
jgi:hypothetical protein